MKRRIGKPSKDGQAKLAAAVADLEWWGVDRRTGAVVKGPLRELLKPQQGV